MQATLTRRWRENWHQGLTLYMRSRKRWRERLPRRMISDGKPSTEGLFGATGRLGGCFNCHEEGHFATDCQQLWCYVCQMEWTGITQPGFHHNSACPLRISIASKRTAFAAEPSQVMPPWKQLKGTRARTDARKWSRC